MSQQIINKYIKLEPIFCLGLLISNQRFICNFKLRDYN